MKQDYLPTPEEIAMECAKIRAEREAKSRDDESEMRGPTSTAYVPRIIRAVIDGKRL